MNPTTQSKAWQDGYAWATSSSKLGCHETCEAYGYDFDTKEYRDFMNGADFRQGEQWGDEFGYKLEDEA